MGFDLMGAFGGYDGKYGLTCRRADGAQGQDLVSDDEAALRARARGLMAGGEYARIDLRVWNFELNDWVRIETFEPG